MWEAQAASDSLQADGTTLGSDNGIGVSAALALLDAPKTALLPPLECLFTIDEETGLTGAFGLDGTMLRGRIMASGLVERRHGCGVGLIHRRSCLPSAAQPRHREH